jgi:hypothetical protein
LYSGEKIALNQDCVVLKFRDEDKDKYILDYIDGYYASGSDVWNKDESIYRPCTEMQGYDMIPCSFLVQKAKQLHKRFPIISGRYDQFTGYGLEEHVRNAELTQIKMMPEGDGINMQMYQLLKSFYSNQMLEIFDHPVLIPELKTLEEKKNGRKMRVEAPNRDGMHDDFSDAYVRAVWECYNFHKKKGNEHAIISANSRSRVCITNNPIYSYQKSRERQFGVNKSRGGAGQAMKNMNLYRGK